MFYCHTVRPPLKKTGHVRNVKTGPQGAYSPPPTALTYTLIPTYILPTRTLSLTHFPLARSLLIRLTRLRDSYYERKYKPVL